MSYMYVNASPQAMAASMAQRYQLPMGQADLPGIPQDRYSHSMTSSVYREPESGFRQIFRKAADWFGSFSTIASIVSFFYPPAAAVAAVSEAVSPAVSMTLAGMDQAPPPMMTVATNTHYNPNFR